MANKYGTPKLMGRFVCFDEMTWPACGQPIAELGWNLRYAPENLTREDQLVLASIVDAYTQMVNDTQDKRNEVCKSIREAVISGCIERVRKGE